MTVQSKHIISKVKWETTIDAKQKAVELQQRISHFNKFKLERIINTIFDQYCPSDQLWTIPYMELNLGTISLDEYEEILDQKIPELISDILNTFILYKHRHINQIKVLDENASQVTILQNYLMYGLQPNWMDVDRTELKRVIEQQLRTNRAAFVVQLLQWGKKENVRKRLAWQLPFSTIKKVIKAVEPGNYTDIIDLGQELYTAQQKDSNLIADSSSFMKSLALWILTFLFEERGTFFNKLDYTKSLLRQMARHYNLSITHLLTKLLACINGMTLTRSHTHEFIRIIHLIASEESTIAPIIQPNQTNPWQKLDNWLSGNWSPNPEETNDLLLTLARQDIVKLLSRINNIGVKSIQSVFKPYINEVLHDNYFLQSAYADVAYIKNLKQLLLQSMPTLTPQEYYQKAAHYLIQNSSKNWNIMAFLAHVSASTQQNKKLLEKLTLNAYISGNSLDSRITSALYTQYKKTLGSSLKDAIIRSLKVFLSTQNSSIQVFNKDIERFLDMDAHLFWECILEWKDEKELIPLIPILNTDKYRDAIVQADPALKEIFAAVTQFLEHKNTKKIADVYIIERWEKHLLQHAIQLKIKEASISIYSILKSGIAAILKSLPPKDLPLFIRFFNALCSYTSFGKYKKIQSLPFQFEKLLLTKRKASLASEIQTQITSGANQVHVAQLLNTFLLEEQHNYKTLSNQLKISLWNYLMSNQDYWQAKNLLTLIKQQVKNTSQKNIEWQFWYILSDYQSHNGSLAQLRQNIYRYLSIQFPDVAANLNTDLLVQPNETLSILKNFILKKEGTNASKFFAPLKAKNTQQQTAALLEHVLQLEKLSYKKVLDANLREKLWRILINQNNTDIEQFTQRLLAGITDSTIRIKVEWHLWIALSHYKKHRGSIVRLRQHLIELISINIPILKPTQLFTKPTSQQIDKHTIHLSSANALMIALKTISSETPWKKQAVFMEAILLKLSATAHTSYLFDAIFDLKNIIRSILPGAKQKELLSKIWLLLKPYFQNKQSTHDTLLAICKEVLLTLQLQHNISPANTVAYIKKAKLSLTPQLQHCLELHSAAFTQLTYHHQENKAINLAKECKLLSELCAHILKYGQLPAYFTKETGSTAVQEFMQTLVAEHPLLVFHSIQSTTNYHVHIHQFLPITSLIRVAATVSSIPQHELNNLLKLYNAFSHFTSVYIRRLYIQEIIYKLTFWALQQNKWNTLKPKNFWLELLYRIGRLKGTSKKQLLQDIKTLESLLPPTYRMSLTILLTPEALASEKSKPFLLEEKPKVLTESIAINNAGLTLINSYLPLLLDRLKCLENDLFVDEQSQLNTAHHLQYLVTGQSETDETHLALNKVLCGLHPTTAIHPGYAHSTAQKELMNGLLKAIISHWPAIGKTSIDGFRGNWLVREGLLTEYEDKWELNVKARAYDLLINKSPFSISMIKLPWMNKVLHVNWSY